MVLRDLRMSSCRSRGKASAGVLTGYETDMVVTDQIIQSISRYSKSPRPTPSEYVAGVKLPKVAGFSRSTMSLFGAVSGQ